LLIGNSHDPEEPLQWFGHGRNLKKSFEFFFLTLKAGVALNLT